MTAELTRPTPELTERLRREVGQDERITGMKMSVMGGANPVPLYSLSAVASFLKIGSYEEAMRPNNQETIGYIDLSALAEWVRGVFGDDELARAIEAEVQTGDAYGIAAPRVKQLLQTRALQVAPAGQAGETEAVPAASDE